MDKAELEKMNETALEAQKNTNKSISDKKDFANYKEMRNVLKNDRELFLSQRENRHANSRLTEYETMIILKHHFYIKKIGSMNNAAPAFYVPFGKNNGIYTQNNDDINTIIRYVEPRFDEAACKRVLFYLKTDDSVTDIEPNNNKNLIPFNNGIYDKQKNKLINFNHNYIFTSKIATNYNEHATTSPNIDGWNVEKFINDLANNDKEIALLLWQVIASVVNSNQTKNVAFFLYSEQGGTGKSTFQSLLKNIVGKHNYTTLKVTDFNERFAMSQLLGKILCIGDDINGDAYIKDNGNFNSVVTHDPVTIEYKGQNAFSTVLNTTVVQSCNGVPKFSNIAGAQRRLCIIPFNRSFINNNGNELVKSDYINRKCVKEYIVNKVAHMNFNKLVEPKAVEDVKNEYLKTANSVYSFKADFWDVIIKDHQINKIPVPYLYGWYINYCRYSNYPRLSPHMFTTKFFNLISEQYNKKVAKLSNNDMDQLRNIDDKRLIDGYHYSLTAFHTQKAYNSFTLKLK